MKNQKCPVGAREKLPFWFYPVWSFSDGAIGISMVLIAYVTYYCTDVLGLSAAVIGVIMLGIRLTDGITDLLMGFIIDHTRTRFGQARPYEISAALTWLFIMLLFATPNASKPIQYLWIGVMYFLVTAVCQTVYYGEQKIYMLRAIPNTDNRTRLISISGSLTMLLTIGVSILLPQLVKSAGTSLASWKKMILMVGLPMMILCLFRIILVPEADTDRKTSSKTEKSASFNKSVRALFSNRYLMILTLLYFLMNLITNINTLVGTYFCKYYIGDIGIASLTGTMMLLVPVLLLFVPKFIGKFGSRTLLIFCFICGTIAPIVRIIGGKSIVGLMVSSLFTTFFTLFGSVLMIFSLECMEYGTWKTGVNINGIIGSFTTVAMKVAGGLASVFCGAILSSAGYDGSLAEQSSSAMNAILSLYNILPAILAAIGIVFSFMYTIGKYLPEIRKANSEEAANETN